MSSLCNCKGYLLVCLTTLENPPEKIIDCIYLLRLLGTTRQFIHVLTLTARIGTFHYVGRKY